MACKRKWSVLCVNAACEARTSWLPLDMLLVFRSREITVNK